MMHLKIPSLTILMMKGMITMRSSILMVEMMMILLEMMEGRTRLMVDEMRWR